MKTESINLRISTLSILFFAITTTWILAGCSSNNGTATVTSVAITATVSSVQINTTTDITAVVNLSNNSVTTNTAVTWQVNGIAGGSSIVGTILSSPTDPEVGIYTAPAIVPTDNNGQVSITATAPQIPSSATSTTIVTSNTVVITIGIGQGLSVTPTTKTVGAKGTFQFSALLNNVADPSATWTISSPNGACLPAANGADCGSIVQNSGAYTAPAFPPPGATITVTATDGSATATSTVTIAYSDQSLSGPFAFSYTGNDTSGFAAIAGRFFADGAGNIVSGVEDVDSFSTGGPQQFQISGTYVVGPDGRGNAVINLDSEGGATWQFALTTNQHASMIRFDDNFTGSGTMDQQNSNDLSSSLSLVDGPFVFSVSGSDAGFSPMAIAGRFSSNGGGGTSAGTAILDFNDNGTVHKSDTSLNISYAFDPTQPNTGRGTLTLTSNSTPSPLTFAFYMVDGTHIHLVETDSIDFLAGEMFNAVAPAPFAAANYAFTAGGTSASGAYAAGGVFAAGASNNITGGIFDQNNAGTTTLATALTACAYTVDPATGRMDIPCLAGSSSEFALYKTASASSTALEPSALMIELDSNAVSIGTTYQQQTLTQPSGSFALNLAGQGMFHNSQPSYQENVNGQLTVGATIISSGNLDINNFNNRPFAADPISTTTSSIAVPDATNGRGTAVLGVTDPVATYNLVYYLIDDNTALLLDSDTTRILIGTVARQF